MVEVDFIPEKVHQKVVLLKMIEVSMVKLFVTFTSGIHCHEIFSCIGLPNRQVDSDVNHCNCLLFFVHKVVEFQVSEAFSE